MAGWSDGADALTGLSDSGMSARPPPPASTNQQERDEALNTVFARPDNKVTDDNLKSAVVIDVFVGSILFILFVVFQSRSVLYKYRLVSPSVTVKPPPLPKGVSALWAWLVATITTSDQDLLDSAGLDACMLVKMTTYGIQLFVPIMILGVAVLLPTHISGHFLDSQPTFGNQAGFMRLTTTNIPMRSDVLWLHFVFVWLYIFWGCWLLKWHYHQYVTLRQHWLIAGDDVNYWRALHAQADEDASKPKPRQTFAGIVSNLPLLKSILQAPPPPEEPEDRATPPTPKSQREPGISRRVSAYTQGALSPKSSIPLPQDAAPTGPGIELSATSATRAHAQTAAAAAAAAAGAGSTTPPLSSPRGAPLKSMDSAAAEQERRRDMFLSGSNRSSRQDPERQGPTAPRSVHHSLGHQSSRHQHPQQRYGGGAGLLPLGMQEGGPGNMGVSAPIQPHAADQDLMQSQSWRLSPQISCRTSPAGMIPQAQSPAPSPSPSQLQSQLHSLPQSLPQSQAQLVDPLGGGTLQQQQQQQLVQAQISRRRSQLPTEQQQALQQQQSQQQQHAGLRQMPLQLQASGRQQPLTGSAASSHVAIPLNSGGGAQADVGSVPLGSEGGRSFRQQVSRRATAPRTNAPSRTLTQSPSARSSRTRREPTPTLTTMSRKGSSQLPSLLSSTGGGAGAQSGIQSGIQSGLHSGLGSSTGGLTGTSPSHGVTPQGGGRMDPQAWEKEMREFEQLINQDLAELGGEPDGASDSSGDEGSALPAYFPLKSVTSHATSHRRTSIASCSRRSTRTHHRDPGPAFTTMLQPPSQSVDVEMGMVGHPAFTPTGATSPTSAVGSAGAPGTAAAAGAARTASSAAGVGGGASGGGGASRTTSGGGVAAVTSASAGLRGAHAHGHSQQPAAAAAASHGSAGQSQAGSGLLRGHSGVGGGQSSAEQQQQQQQQQQQAGVVGGGGVRASERTGRVGSGGFFAGRGGFPGGALLGGTSGGVRGDSGALVRGASGFASGYDPASLTWLGALGVLNRMGDGDGRTNARSALTAGLAAHQAAAGTGPTPTPHAAAAAAAAPPTSSRMNPQQPLHKPHSRLLPSGALAPPPTPRTSQVQSPEQVSAALLPLDPPSFTHPTQPPITDLQSLQPSTTPPAFPLSRSHTSVARPQVGSSQQPWATNTTMPLPPPPSVPPPLKQPPFAPTHSILSAFAAHAAQAAAAQAFPGTHFDTVSPTPETAVWPPSATATAVGAPVSAPPPLPRVSSLPSVNSGGLAGDAGTSTGAPAGQHQGSSLARRRGVASLTELQMVSPWQSIFPSSDSSPVQPPPAPPVSSPAPAFSPPSPTQPTHPPPPTTTAPPLTQTHANALSPIPADATTAAAPNTSTPAPTQPAPTSANTGGGAHPGGTSYSALGLKAPMAPPPTPRSSFSQMPSLPHSHFQPRQNITHTRPHAARPFQAGTSASTSTQQHARSGHSGTRAQGRHAGPSGGAATPPHHLHHHQQQQQLPPQQQQQQQRQQQQQTQPYQPRAPLPYDSQSHSAFAWAQRASREAPPYDPSASVFGRMRGARLSSTDSQPPTPPEPPSPPSSAPQPPPHPQSPTAPPTTAPPPPPPPEPPSPPSSAPQPPFPPPKTAPPTPAPTPTAATPAPTPTAATPAPTPTAATPAPTPTAATPAPTPTAATPAPTPTAAARSDQQPAESIPLLSCPSADTQPCGLFETVGQEASGAQAHSGMGLLSQEQSGVMGAPPPQPSTDTLYPLSPPSPSSTPSPASATPTGTGSLPSSSLLTMPPTLPRAPAHTPNLHTPAHHHNAHVHHHQPNMHTPALQLPLPPTPAAATPAAPSAAAPTATPAPAPPPPATSAAGMSNNGLSAPMLSQQQQLAGSSAGATNSTAPPQQQPPQQQQEQSLPQRASSAHTELSSHPSQQSLLPHQHTSSSSITTPLAPPPHTFSSHQTPHQLTHTPSPQQHAPHTSPLPQSPLTTDAHSGTRVPMHRLLLRRLLNHPRPTHHRPGSAESLSSTPTPGSVSPLAPGTPDGSSPGATPSPLTLANGVNDATPFAANSEHQQLLQHSPPSEEAARAASMPLYSLAPLSVVTEGQVLPLSNLHQSLQAEGGPQPEGSTTHTSPPKALPLKRSSMYCPRTHRRAASQGGPGDSSGTPLGGRRVASHGDLAGQDSTAQGANAGDHMPSLRGSLGSLSMAKTSVHKACSSKSSLDLYAGLGEEEGTVSVLPEWWSPATQTTYDPAAVHIRRMSRHKRSVSKDSMKQICGKDLNNLNPDQLAALFEQLPTVADDALDEQQVDKEDGGPTDQPKIPRVSSAPLLQGSMLDTGEPGAHVAGPEPPPDDDDPKLQRQDTVTYTKTSVKEGKPASWNRSVLARPSVRHLKTVNTFDDDGYVVSVNAQQYAVLVTDVNQSLWTGKPLWHSDLQEEGQGMLSWILPQWLRKWVMSNYAIHVRTLYDDPPPAATSSQHGSRTLAQLFQLRKQLLHGQGSDKESVEPLLRDIKAGPSDADMGEGAAAGYPQQSSKAGPVAEGDEQQQGAQQGSQGNAGLSRRSLLGRLLSPEPRPGAVHSSQAGTSSENLPTMMVYNPLANPLTDPLTATQNMEQQQQHFVGHSHSNHHHHHHHHQRSLTSLTGKGAPSSTSSAHDLPTLNSNIAAPTPTPAAAAPTAAAGGKGFSSPGGSRASSPVLAVKDIDIDLEEDAAAARHEAAAESEARLHTRACWDFVREAVFDGRVRALLLSKDYSLVTATFARLFPNEFDRALPVFNHIKVDQLLAKLDFHHAAYSKAYATFKRRSKRPRHRTRCCGCCGPKVDSLAYHLQRVHELEERIKEARKETVAKGSTPSWFVLFKTQQAAAVAAQSIILAEDNYEFTVRPAPGPEEVNWQALNFSYKQRNLRLLIVQPLLLLLIAFPIGLFSGALMQLDFLFCPLHRCEAPDGTVSVSNTACTEDQKDLGADVEKAFQWEWYCSDKNFFAEYLSKLITGWVPSLLVTLWQNMVLPIVMFLLVQAGGSCFSMSQVDEKVATYIFWHNAGQVFLGGLIGSTFAQQINQFFEAGPAAAIDILGTYLPASSNFFLTYLLLRLLVLVPFRLMIPHLAVRLYIFRRWICRCSRATLTPREKAFLYTPTSIRIGFEIGMLLLIFLIVMSFSVVAPIMPVVGVVFFCAVWVLWRHAVLYIYVRKYESGGLMWPFFFRIMLMIFAIFGIFVACVFAVKRAYVQALLLLFLVPIFLYQFNYYIYYRFARSTVHVPLRLANSAPPAHLSPRTYIPPPMNERSVGWHPEWMLAWAGWGIPAAYCVT